jgi:hypothetical protein
MDDLYDDEIDPSLLQRPKVNYFTREIEKSSRYAIAFVKNIKYLLGQTMPENIH